MKSLHKLLGIILTCFIGTIVFMAEVMVEVSIIGEDGPMWSMFLYLVIAGLAMYLFAKRWFKGKAQAAEQTPAPKTVQPEVRQPVQKAPSQSTAQVKRPKVSFDYISVGNYSKVMGIKHYAVLDVETTGLSTNTDKIVEIGIVLVDDGVTSTFHSFVNPEMHIPAAASRVNHIYDADVETSPTYAEIAPAVYNKLSGYTLIAHNAQFDTRFLHGLLLCAENAEDTTYAVLDTLGLARKHISGVPNYKLDTLTAHFGIERDKAHRALDDAMATQKMFELIREQMILDKKRKQEEKAKSEEERCAQFAASPLLNVHFVFTGEFTTPRDDLESYAKDVGAFVRTSLTGKTQYLVVGNLENYTEAAIAHKYKKADELIAAGQDLKKISEDEYLAMIDDAKKHLG